MIVLKESAKYSNLLFLKRMKKRKLAPNLKKYQWLQFLKLKEMSSWPKKRRRKQRQRQG